VCGLGIGVQHGKEISALLSVIAGPDKQVGIALAYPVAARKISRRRELRTRIDFIFEGKI